MAANQNTMPQDADGRRIQGSFRQCTHVANQAVTNGGFVAITVPAGIYFKRLIIQSRAGSDFLFSTTEGGTTYYTVKAAMELPLAGKPADVIGYFKSSVASDTVEVIFLD